jgi:hypothetical protein
VNARYLGGVKDESLAAQMEIIAENEVSYSGEENVGGAIQRMMILFLVEGPITQQLQSSNL